MDRNTILKSIFCAAALALAACTQDYEMADADAGDANGEALPEGMYPLQIGSISVSAEGSGQPWTRVAETSDGSGSVFETGDMFYVKFESSDEVGTYKITESGGVEAVKPVYWTEKTGNIIAWYISGSDSENATRTVDVSNQSGGLAYVMRAGKNGLTIGDNVSLSFIHQLAKVRAVLDGSQAGQVSDIKIKSYTTCTHTQGTVSTSGAASVDWITMKYDSVQDYYEANVVPGYTITDFQINGTVNGTLDGSGITPEAGKMHTIDLTVGTKIITLSDFPGTEIVVSGKIKTLIEGDGTATNKKITLEDGADVTLSNINITNNYIECKGNATIRIADGTKNKIDLSAATSRPLSDYPGILLGPANTTVKITGDTGELNVTGGSYAPGIGGLWVDSQERGNIEICGGTITATGGYAGIGTGNRGKIGDIIISGGTVIATGGAKELYFGNQAPGIGASQGGTCGDIIISGGDVTAESKYMGAGIGTSRYYNNNYIGTCGDIKITSGTVTATKYNDSSILHDIGQGYSNTVCGTVSIDMSKAKVTATNKAVKDYSSWTNP